jgi:hypothetical protein
MAVVHSMKTIDDSDLKYTGMTVGAIMDMYAAVSMDSSPADILSGMLASCAPEFDMATSPYQDSASLYVNILASTIGERITLNYSCSCDFKFGVDIDLSKAEVSNKENGPGTGDRFLPETDGDLVRKANSGFHLDANVPLVRYPEGGPQRGDRDGPDGLRTIP